MFHGEDCLNIKENIYLFIFMILNDPLPGSLVISFTKAFLVGWRKANKQ